jgi:hypothetical protein
MAQRSSKIRLNHARSGSKSGGGGIRTHGRLAPPAVFKTITVYRATQLRYSGCSMNIRGARQSLRQFRKTMPDSGERTLAQPSEVGSGIESEDDLVRFLVAPISEPAALAHDHETALRQHANRRGVVARSASVKRTGCLQLQELL